MKNKDSLSKEVLKNKILEVIKGHKLAALATVASGKPWVRLLMCRSQGLNLYICTYKDSRKVAQIKKNPNVHLVIGKDINKLEAPFVQVAGKAKIRSDAKIRNKLWRDFMKKYYSGPDDPNYVIIEVKPKLIEYRSTETENFQVYRN
ncbi:MAG: pyridoxamine 5'-phosphate oxidase family protein [Candidatus Omnitrophota bacterium]|nr:pyridoxamine 5'-phosphate oxidase family protein [Candidatus Omnitrophota bacterium]